MENEKLLPAIRSPRDLRRFNLAQLEQLAGEMREELCNVVANRTAHFASNLGVVELCLALHTVFDFRHDRLIWDTGHQIYPHKLITGRHRQFSTIRTRGGLMGYPNPHESPYDLFMTGHAGCSVSTVLGLRSGDELLGHGERHAVAVIGDGALPSGIVFEALNNALGNRLGKPKLLVVLNDNKMSICPRVGGVADYLDRLRMNRFYTGLKHEVAAVLKQVPLVGDPVERFLSLLKDSIKAGMHGGMLFEELGFHFVGPVDGHSIPQLRKYLKMVKQVDGPVLLHVVTEKGHGFKPAAEDPVYFHTPAPFQREAQAGPVVDSCVQPQMPPAKKPSRAYTDVASAAILDQMRRNPRVTVLTAAMCQGNKLEPIRDALPERFFDTGICESHAVAFAAGQAKAGLRPIVDIYSTFLQRSFDQIFQEVALQNLPVTFMLDRAGLTGPDGPTHHGMFDLGYLRLFPNMTVMAPGDADDLVAMLNWALAHDGPASIRYPKATAASVGSDAALADFAGQCHPSPSQTRDAIELGRAELFHWGADGMLIACGTLLGNCLKAAAQLRDEGLDIGVINARFVKPLDRDLILRAIEECPLVVTVEEGALMTGFGSAVLEAAADAAVAAANVRRLGIPDRFIEHGERDELLADLGLDAEGIVRACRSADASAAVQTADYVEARGDEKL